MVRAFESISMLANNSLSSVSSTTLSPSLTFTLLLLDGQMCSFHFFIDDQRLTALLLILSSTNFTSSSRPMAFLRWCPAGLRYDSLSHHVNYMVTLICKWVTKLLNGIYQLQDIVLLSLGHGIRKLVVCCCLCRFESSHFMSFIGDDGKLRCHMKELCQSIMVLCNANEILCWLSSFFLTCSKPWSAPIAQNGIAFFIHNPVSIHEFSPYFRVWLSQALHFRQVHWNKTSIIQLVMCEEVLHKALCCVKMKLPITYSWMFQDWA